MSGCYLDERSQTRIGLREGQVIGERQLITRQRQLGKDQDLRLVLRGNVSQSNMLLDVYVNLPRDRDRLSDSYRAGARHVHKLNGGPDHGRPGP